MTALVVAPVVTGILVVGMAVCAAQRSRAKTAAVVPSVEDRMEGGTDLESSIPIEQPVLGIKEPDSREDKIAAALVKTVDYITDRWCALDDRFAISTTTLRTLASVQEMDERNKVSETVVTKLKEFDEKYQVVETAGVMVTATVTKAHELDAACNLSENALIAGNNLAIAGHNTISCICDLERRYDISTRITTALVFAMATVTTAISAYMNRLTAPAAPATPTDGDLVEVLESIEEGHGQDQDYDQAERLVLPSAPTYPVDVANELALPVVPTHTVDTPVSVYVEYAKPVAALTVPVQLDEVDLSEEVEEEVEEEEEVEVEVEKEEEHGEASESEPVAEHVALSLAV